LHKFQSQAPQGIPPVLEANDSQSYHESHPNFHLAQSGKLMPQNYVPIFIFIAAVAIMIPLPLLLAKLVRPENPSKAKLMPYECGIDPVDNSRGRYTVRYYIVAILFVVFDVETIFLFPWAVKFKALGAFGLVEMLIFLAILVVGYIWIWKKGALEWI
jgi:NADH-quinone oxidoreductase subunit A